MPPKSKPAAQPAEPEVDRAAVLAAEAAPPSGWELLRPLHAMSRRQRADVVKALGRVTTTAASLDAKVTEADADAELSPDNLTAVAEFTVAAGVMLQAIADMEDTLVLAAYDETRFRAWASAVEDDDLTRLFNHYASSAGEALASPS